VSGPLLHPLPLLRYLFLRTETHAYCAGLAFFAMLAFYPFSLLLVSLAKYVFGSAAAHDVVRDVLRELYPTAQGFLLRNLEASSWQFGEAMTVQTVAWVLLGAAGVFIPLETALNDLWGFENHRPYWRNQLVGFLLTVTCCGLAVGGVLLAANLGRSSGVLPGVGFAYVAVSLFLFYRFLPNGSVPARAAAPGALAGALALAGVRWVFLWSLPHLDLRSSQGPYHVSISFLLLAYFGAFAVLGGAFVATEEARRRLPPEGDGSLLGLSGANPDPDAEASLITEGSLR
jgi:membrane protein